MRILIHIAFIMVLWCHFLHLFDARRTEKCRGSVIISPFCSENGYLSNDETYAVICHVLSSVWYDLSPWIKSILSCSTRKYC